MSMVGRREKDQEKQHYRGNKLQFLSYRHGALLPVVIKQALTVMSFRHQLKLHFFATNQARREGGRGHFAPGPQGLRGLIIGEF